MLYLQEGTCLMKIDDMDTRKIVQALAFFAFRQPEHRLDNMKAYKLLWLADRFQLRQSGRFLSGDRYFAMPLGPVPSDAKNILECKATRLDNDEGYVADYLELGDKNFVAKKDPDLRVFSISDRDVLVRVLELFGNKSATDLSKMSHDFPEWLAYKMRLEDKNCQNSYPIDIDLFFENAEIPEAKGFFDDDPEALGLARDLYHQVNRI